MSRLDGLLDALRKFYGALPKPPRDPFTLFVWEVLSMHSTPQKRDAALGALKRIPALTPDAMWRAPQKKLEESGKLAGADGEQRPRAPPPRAGPLPPAPHPPPPPPRPPA